MIVSPEIDAVVSAIVPVVAPVESVIVPVVPVVPMEPVVPIPIPVSAMAAVPVVSTAVLSFFEHPAATSRPPNVASAIRFLVFIFERLVEDM